MSGVNSPKPSSRAFASVALTTAADGTSESFNVTGLTLSAIQMSTAWTSADIGFKASIDGSTNYYQVYTSTGGVVSYAVGASRVVALDPTIFSGLERLQLVSQSTDGSGTAVAQAAARTLILGLSEFVNSN